MKPTLASRRARVARIQAKHPRTVIVEVQRDPDDGARDELIDVLFDLLDSVVHSGRS